MKIVIVTHKPVWPTTYRKAIQSRYPSVDLDAVPIITFFQYCQDGLLFDLPRDLKWNALPVVQTPRHKPDNGLTLQFGIGKDRQSGATVADDIRDILEVADEILLLSYSGDTDVMDAAEAVFMDVLGAIPVGKIRMPLSLEHDGDPSGFTSISMAIPYEHVAGKIAAGGALSRHFDYNYLVNAMPILGRAARNAGLEKGPPSAFGLQLLYHIRAERSPFPKEELISILENWSGDGKHVDAVGVGMGSPKSRSAIVERLIEGGYLKDTPWFHGDKAYYLSPEASTFLEGLHRSCRDPDLPFRLKFWSRLPWDEGLGKMHRYVRTFFGRQMKFLGRAAGASSV